MPLTNHIEKHLTASEVVRETVIGMADGLTVPFALAAGLSGAISSTHVVVTAGLAEVAAGSIAMGLGGFLAARGDMEHYRNERQREVQEVEEKPQVEEHEVAEVFREYGLTDVEIAPIITALRAQPEKWVDFMMRFELGLEEPAPKRAGQSALTIAGAYVAGGLVPLAPYILMRSASQALLVSALVTLIALFIFGFVKSRFSGSNPLRGATETVLVGGLAATAAFALAKLFA